MPTTRKAVLFAALVFGALNLAGGHSGPLPSFGGSAHASPVVIDDFRSAHPFSVSFTGVTGGAFTPPTAPLSEVLGGGRTIIGGAPTGVTATVSPTADLEAFHYERPASSAPSGTSQLRMNYGLFAGRPIDLDLTSEDSLQVLLEDIQATPESSLMLLVDVVWDFAPGKPVQRRVFSAGFERAADGSAAAMLSIADLAAAGVNLGKIDALALVIQGGPLVTAFDVTHAAIVAPEPSTTAAFALAGVGLVARRHRSRR